MKKSMASPSGKQFKYSNSLLKRFQKLYFEKFDEQISEEKAILELDFFSTIVRLLLEKELSSKEVKNEN